MSESWFGLLVWHGRIGRGRGSDHKRSLVVYSVICSLLLRRQVPHLHQKRRPLAPGFLFLCKEDSTLTDLYGLVNRRGFYQYQAFPPHFPRRSFCRRQCECRLCRSLFRLPPLLLNNENRPWFMPLARHYFNPTLTHLGGLPSAI